MKEQRINEIVNVLYMLVDVAESYITELPQHMEITKGVKYRFTPTVNNIRSLVREISATIKDEDVIGDFQNEANMLIDYIDNVLIK